ncbi:MAG: FAD-dependent oxidoreductase, partial [Clostridia bacterium]|nr:FAD-dependent oxidoreductase [Clostridia bacterium]
MLKTRLLIFVLIACLVTPYFACAAVADIVVDNNDAGFSTTGSWRKGENAQSINGDFLAANDTSSTATWNFQVPVAGSYEVYIIYPHRSATNVPVEIAQSGGVMIGNSLRQNQFSNAWHYLGKYYFAPTEESYVKISSEFHKDCAADAIKVVYSERQTEPVEKSNKQGWERMLSLSVMMKIDNPLLYINGKEQTADVAPLILNSRTFLPLRAIGEGLGGAVSYDDATKTVTILRNGKTISLTIGNPSITVDGTAMEIDAAPFIENSRTMVPVRAIAEGFGMKVHYDNGLILITEDEINVEQQANIIADMHKKFDYVPQIPSDTIIVEAEAFSDMGGWVLDQQGMDLMGSPYLMAHGLGIPVKNATTTFKTEKAGDYRMWVRTKDWTEFFKTNGAPGQFKIIINGKEKDTVFGLEGEDWYWQDAGVVTLRNGENKLELKDLTGFNGRCDAVLFTTDLNYKPIDGGYELVAFRDVVRNDTITDKGHFDLVVVGAGVAGACLAVGAARQGLKVALIQDRPVIGGNSSSEVHVGVSGNGNFLPYPGIGDLVNEYKKSNKNKFVSNEKNITLLLNYHADAVDVRADKSIEAVYATDTVLGGKIKVTGDLFADCTGDGTLGYIAGADCESKSEGIMGSTNVWGVRDTGAPVEFPEIDWGFDLTDVNFPGRNADSDEKIIENLGRWYWESGMFMDNAIEGERVRDNNLLGMFSAWNTLKNVDKRLLNYEVKSATYITGKRESRRLMGDVVLNTPDIYYETEFVDGLVPCTWTVDLHYADTKMDMDKLETPFITYCIQVPYTSPFWLPYRTLYSRNIPNLFMAGRDISVTHD